MKLRKWTTRDHQAVLDNIDQPDPVIAAIINRTAYAVGCYRKRKGLKKTNGRGVCQRKVKAMNPQDLKHLLTCCNIPQASFKYGISVKQIYRIRQAQRHA